MWYQVIPICMGSIGLFLVVVGVWGILQWDIYSKLLSNLKEIIEKVTL